MGTILIQTVTVNKAKFLTFGFFSNPPRKSTTCLCNPRLLVSLSLFPSPEKGITERLLKWAPYSVTLGTAHRGASGPSSSQELSLAFFSEFLIFLVQFYRDLFNKWCFCPPLPPYVNTKLPETRFLYLDKNMSELIWWLLLLQKRWPVSLLVHAYMKYKGWEDSSSAGKLLARKHVILWVQFPSAQVKTWR